MLPNHIRLNRLKRSGTHMQRQLTAADATAVKVGKRALREVQPGSRCCYRTLDMGLDGLIILRVARLGVAVQIWRDRNLAHRIKDRGECHRAVAP